MEIKNNQTWIAKGKRAKWTIWNIDEEVVSLTREDILNPGYGGKRYEKLITKKELLKRYIKC